MTSLKIFVVSLFLAMILIATNNSYAQTYKWEFGVEGGAGIRSLRTSPKDSILKTDVSFTGGIAGQYNMSPMLSLKLGAAYERKGAKFESTVTTKTGTTTVTGKENIDYVAIPLLLKVNFGNGKKLKFFVNAGPFVGILLANKVKNDNTGTEVDIKDSTKKVDFGIAGGVGLNVLVGTNMSFTVEARDNFGLTNINDSKVTNATEVKTNTANLMLGFAWKFGKGYTAKKK